jgi:hypothetical protein
MHPNGLRGLEKGETYLITLHNTAGQIFSMEFYANAGNYSFLMKLQISKLILSKTSPL